MRVVVTDSVFASHDLEQQILEPLVQAFELHQCKTPEALIPVVRDADVIITQFAPLRAEVIAAMRRARAIVRYGIGVDNIDLDAAREHRIPVCNVPDYCIDEVADTTLAFILAATRQVVANCLSVRSGKWCLPGSPDDMKTLSDLTVGIVGLGRIGRAVASRLTGFGCRRLAFDPALRADAISATGCEPVELTRLLHESDIVTLHCPSIASTRGMINRHSIGGMKRGAILINVARGDLVDSAALIEALESGQLAAAALDVFSPEPIPADSRILKLPNVILAAHLASVSAKALHKLRETVALTAAAAVRGEKLPNIVNGVPGVRL